MMMKSLVVSLHLPLPPILNSSLATISDQCRSLIQNHLSSRRLAATNCYTKCLDLRERGIQKLGRCYRSCVYRIKCNSEGSSFFTYSAPLVSTPMEEKNPGSDPGSEGEACSVSDILHHDEVWYFSIKEIEQNSPSRLDGIDLKKETSMRKSYCSFLKDLGDRLNVPQRTIATAIIFCHRFFIRQSKMTDG